MSDGFPWASRASSSFESASDLTVDEGAAIVRPQSIEEQSSGGTVTVYLNVTDPDQVDVNRFELRIRAEADRIAATRASCAADANETWDPEVKFALSAILDLVDGGPGIYDIVISGWWTDDRSLEAAGELIV